MRHDAIFVNSHEGIFRGNDTNYRQMIMNTSRNENENENEDDLLIIRKT